MSDNVVLVAISGRLFSIRELQTATIDRTSGVAKGTFLFKREKESTAVEFNLKGEEAEFLNGLWRKYKGV